MGPTAEQASFIHGGTVQECSVSCTEEATSIPNTEEKNGSESCGSLNTENSQSPSSSSSSSDDEDGNGKNLLGLGGYGTDPDIGDSG